METLSRPDCHFIELTKIDIRGRTTEDRCDPELEDNIELAESILADGLLQPIVIEENPEGSEFPYRLIAGGRRYTAYTLLVSNKVKSEAPLLFTHIPAMLRSELSDHVRIKLELEENLRRTDMTWQQTCLGIYKYHKACQRAALIEGDKWSQQATGNLLNFSQAHVSNAIMVAKEIINGHKLVLEAGSFLDAIKVLASAKLDEAAKEQLKRIQARRAEIVKQASEGVSLASAAFVPQASPASGPVLTGVVGDLTVKPAVTPDAVAAMYYHGDSLKILKELATKIPLHHIICDPPYGIDMDNLVMEGVDRVIETHQVKENIQLIEDLLYVAFQSIQEDGFMCMWYDLDHHEKIHQWATKIGWRVQRWPLVWCKSSNCRNSQAQYNITKSTEVCYMLRRSEKSILKQKRSSNYIIAPSVATASHPFVKPREVWNYLLESVSMEGQTIVDPFAGQGSCLAAAFSLKRNPIGIEIDEKHIASGVNYIADQVNKKSALDDLFADSPI